VDEYRVAQTIGDAPELQQFLDMHARDGWTVTSVLTVPPPSHLAHTPSLRFMVIAKRPKQP
jgi:hypothetical protein